MTVVASEQDQRGLRNVRLLLGAAIAAVLIAALAGLSLLVFQPADGSNAESALGFTAAVSGLSVAGFAVAAAIYAQTKNLWRFAPMWIRLISWAFILVGVAITVVNLIKQVL